MSYDPAYHKRYREQHREKIRERKRQDYLSNREAIKARSREWAALHRDQKVATSVVYRKRMRERILAYMKERYRHDPQRHISAMSAWRQANPSRYRDQYLRATFGISLSDYNVLLKRQGGVCAICRAAPKTILVVDHDHVTGGVRGLLCSTCNTGLGQFKDDPQRIRRAAEYLDERTVKNAEIA